MVLTNAWQEQDKVNISVAKPKNTIPNLFYVILRLNVIIKNNSFMRSGSLAVL